jgi:hypothetical protein
MANAEIRPAGETGDADKRRRSDRDALELECTRRRSEYFPSLAHHSCSAHISFIGNDRGVLQRQRSFSGRSRHSWEGSPMNTLRKYKIVMLLALIGLGASASLTACVFEEGGRGGHERHWQ